MNFQMQGEKLTESEQTLLNLEPINPSVSFNFLILKSEEENGNHTSKIPMRIISDNTCKLQPVLLYKGTRKLILITTIIICPANIIPMIINYIKNRT